MLDATTIAERIIRPCRFCRCETPQLYSGTFELDDRISLFAIAICESCWCKYGGQEDVSQILIREIVREASRPEPVM